MLKIGLILLYLVMFNGLLLAQENMVSVNNSGDGNANIIYQNSGSSTYYSSFDCDDNPIASSSYLIRKNGSSWEILNSSNQLIYSNPMDSPKPPNEGWAVETNGTAPAPTLAGDVDAFVPNTLSFPTDEFSGGYDTDGVVQKSTVDFGDVTLKTTDDGTGTAFASLTGITGNLNRGFAHGSIIAGNATIDGLGYVSNAGDGANGQWFVFATDNGTEFKLASLDIQETYDYIANIEILGFLDGSEVVSEEVSITKSSTNTGITLSSSLFEYVDEVRIRQKTAGFFDGGVPGIEGAIFDNIVLEAPVAPNVAPTASDVSISGTFALGEQLTGNYTYVDDDSDAESGSTFKWYRSDDASGTGKIAIAGATAQTYTLVADDDGKYISFEVTPSDGVDAGTAVESSLVLADFTVPVWLSAIRNSDTQITITYNEPVQTTGTNPTDFTVTDCHGNTFAVSAQADGTVGDTEIVLTVASLEFAVGDITITYTNNHAEITDLAGNAKATDATGVVIPVQGNFDINAGTYAGISESLDVSGKFSSTNTISMVFNPTGTKLFVAGFGSQWVNEFELATPFDVSTAVFRGAGAQVTSSLISSLAFNPSGTKLFISAFNGYIFEFELTTPFDITTAIYQGDAERLNANLGHQNYSYSFSFNDTGDKLFVLDLHNVREFNLSTPYDVSTAVWAGSDSNLRVSSQESNPYSMAFNPSGTLLFIMGLTHYIYKYEMSTPFDVSTATYLGNETGLHVGDEEGSPSSMAFNTSATKLYVLGAVGRIFTYNLPKETTAPTLTSATKDSDTEITLVFSENVDVLETNPTDFTVTDGLGNTYVVSAISNGTVGDAEVTLTVADLSNAKGDLTVTYTNNNNEVVDFACNALETDATGVSIDADQIAPTLVSATKDNNTQITLTFSEEVQINGADASNFTVEDGNNNGFCVFSLTDGTAQDNKLILGFDNLSSAVGRITITYDPSSGNISDFGGNNLAADATGVEILLDVTAPSGYSVSLDDDLINAAEATSATFTFTGAEVGATYNYTVSSENGGTNVTGSGTVATTTDQITLADLSGLNDGELTLSVQLTDPASNEGIAVTDNTNMDATAPNAPTVGAVGDDNGPSNSDFITNDQSLIIGGLAEANSSVEVFIDDTSVGTTTTNGQGTYLLDYTGTDLSEGDYSITAKATDAAGNTSTASTAQDLDIDLTKPTVTITSNANDSQAGAFTATFTFSEDVSGFASEDISVSNAAVSNFNTTSAKIYTATITPSADGDVDIDVQANKATDAAGNNNTAATQLTVVNDETAPAAPIVSSISSDAGSSATDNLTNDQTLEISGTAEANASVEVFIGGNSIGNTTADGSGNWTYDHTGSSLTEAAHSITAKATDAAGNESAISTALDITVDISAPSVSTGTIVGKTYGLGDNVDVTYVFDDIVLVDETNGTPSVTIAMGGKNRVAAYHSGSGTNTLVFRYTTVAGDIDGNGVNVSAINTNGGTIQDAAGNDASTSISVSGAAGVRVDTSAPYMSITSVSNTVSGAFTATFTFNEDVSGFAEEDISVSNGVASNFNTTSAKIYTATITPSADGNVTVNVAADKVQDAGGNGNTAASELRVVNDETAPAAPVISSISTDAGSSDTDNLTNDQTLEIKGMAEANASVEVFIGGNSIGNTSADGAGDWTYDHTGSSLTEATHSITAKATDAAGNESTESTALSVTVDITAPNAPEVTGISNDTGVSDSDGLTNDDGVEIHGTAEANSIVEVFIDNNSVGTTDADASGNWTFDRSRSALAENTYSITAKATDLAGNESSASDAFSLEIDLTSPVSVPSVGAVGTDRGPSNSDFITNDQTLIIGGNATANSSVEVFIDGTSIGITTTNAQGTWLFDHEGTSLSAGAYSITAKELDGAGNYSPVSATKTLVIDLTQPTVTITSNANAPQKGEFTATFTFSEDVSGFDVNDISVTNGTAGNFSTTSASVYTATITPSADGQVSVGVAANKATDIAGNNNVAATSINVTNDETAPSLVSATKDSDTQLTLTFSEVVAPGANGHTGITVYGGNGKSGNALSASDGTVGDNQIVLAFNSFSTLLGDFEVLHSGGSTVTDLAGNVYPLDGTGAIIDLDQTAPTLVSATKDSETQITLTFSEPVKALGTNPTDFTVEDDNSNSFAVQSITDGNAEDNKLILTVEDLTNAQLNLNITYVNNNNVVTDFGGNSLGSDAIGVDIYLNSVPTATNVDFSGTLIVGETLTGSYTYADTDNDIEDGTIFKWYRSDDTNGANKMAIAGATASTYMLSSTDVGKYISFEVSPNDGINFGVAVESRLQGSISKISQTISFGALAAKTYGDANFTLSATASSNLGVTYTSSNTSVATVSGNSVSIVGAGEATITASQAGDASYAAASDATQVLTVNKATLTATADDKSKVYGEANPTFTITYSGFVNGDDATAITTAPTASTVADITTGVGTYDIDLAGGAADNYSFNLNNGTLTINQATLTATADDKSKVYGEANPVFTLSYAGFVNGDDETAITTEPTASTVANATSGVGTYDIDLAGGAADNYSFNLNSGALTISQATLTATADDKSKVYGEANPDFTLSYAGFVNGDDETAITTEPTASTVADATSGVGTYDIDLAGGAADNYSFNLNSGTLTINQATLTATADDKSKVYGETNPTFTIAYSGFVNGDDATAITTAPAASTIADATSGVGTYDIDLAGGAADNYSFNLNSGTLTINQAILTATADDKSKVYGEENPVFTVVYTGFVNGDDKSVITTEPTASTVADATSGVGTYDITLSGGAGAADNYSLTTVNGTLTIEKATLTATANDKERAEGQKNPEFTISYSGFVNGDDRSVIDTEPIASTTADETTAAGTAAIVLSGGSDNNYSFNLVEGILTIVQASFVTSVTVPDDGTYAIGDEMTFTVNFALPVTITGSPSLPITVGTETKAAMLDGTVKDSNTATFTYTIAEDDLDTDGITVGSGIDLNGTTIVDGFGKDAITKLNNIASTANVKVDGIRAIPTITSAVSDLTNAAFTVTVTYDEPVSSITAEGLTVTNGTASNVTVVTAGLVWTADITPTADGTTTVSVTTGAVTDAAGNASVASTASISTTFDGTAPTVSSISRAEADQVPTGTASRNFRVVFSENVTGVDVTDFEAVVTGTATANVNTVTAVDGKTYTVNVSGISGEGTIGLNAKDDDSIIDAATNPLAAAFTGQVYITNFAPTDITISASSIQENNAVGAEIATISTTDADAGDSHTYTLVSGTGDTDNVSFTINGDKLLAAETFDFEAKNSYSIRVKTDDGFGATFEKAFTIDITNEGEAIIEITGEGDFAQTALGLADTKIWTVSNRGDAATEVRVVSSSQGFSFNPGSVQVNPGESKELTAVFSPTEARQYAGVVVFNFDITDNIQDNVIEVNLSGEGVIVTGVDKGQISEEQIGLYPNPASHYVTVDLSELNGMPVDIQMINPTGVSKLEKEGYDKPELTIDVTNFESGLYIIQFSNERSLVRKKVLIRK